MIMYGETAILLIHAFSFSSLQRAIGDKFYISLTEKSK